VTERSPWRPIVWRGLAFATVYAVAVAALGVGVEVSQRDLTHTGLATKAYYALGLFVLGGLDLGTPLGGPPVGRALLWLAYFVAPVITASAILEAAIRLIAPLAIRLRPLSGHVVLAGAGRLSRLYIRKLRARDAKRSVVVVERDTSHPALGELRGMDRLMVVAGDITSDAVLRSLRLARAHRVLLLTGDDFANLDAAAKILRLAPSMAGGIVTHVSDLGFMRQTAGSSVARDCEIFNGHEFAATNLVEEHLAARFKRTPHRDPVVLGGFGRFGQTVLHQLQQHAPGLFGPVVILDQEATRRARSFQEEPGFEGDYERAVIDGDLLDPDIWRSIEEVTRRGKEEPVIILGSGNDGTNLHAALAVCKRRPDALVIVRSFRTSPFMEEVVAEEGAHAFNLGELIGSGMPGRWF